jgi:hypothetical protein
VVSTPKVPEVFRRINASNLTDLRSDALVVIRPAFTGFSEVALVQFAQVVVQNLELRRGPHHEVPNYFLRTAST